jgi:RimJ/RimL family protein N-acetyltransferase
MAFIKKNISLPVSDTNLRIILRTANKEDLNNLRKWKNEHRDFFFFKGIITPEQQREWFRNYQSSPENYMFIVTEGGKAFGCMGIRLIDSAWDVYNVILGSPKHGGKGLMSKAFQAMLRFALLRHPLPITIQVLKHNPAMAWYQKNGFVITSEQPDHYCVLFQPIHIREETP